MVGVFALIALLSQTQTFILESRLKTVSGIYERFVDPSNENTFKVRWTRLDGKTKWIVDQDDRSSKIVFRRQPLGLMASHFEDVMEKNLRTGEERLIGRAKRVFHSDSTCSAVAFVATPTVDNLSWFQNLKNLNCDETNHPQISNLSVEFDTDEHPFEAPCHLGLPGFCLWVSDSQISGVNKGQLLSLTTLQLIEEFFKSARVKLSLPRITVDPWAMNTNNSKYDAQTKTVFLGLGQYPDAHDGFVIAHEWTHFLIDQLNPGLWGYDAEVFHEAISDFLATDFWGSPCFAPYDAREVSGRDCLRRMDTHLKYPEDMMWSDVHADSKIFSGALWEGMRDFSKEIRWAVLLETIISLPKNFEADEFWKTAFASLGRQSLLPSSRGSAESLAKILRQRGFLSQRVKPSHSH